MIWKNLWQPSWLKIYLSPNMREKLHNISLNTIKDVLEAPEDKLKEAHYVGDIRARRMKRIALNSVYEYLIG